MNRQTISDVVGSIEETYVQEAALDAAEQPAAAPAPAPAVVRPQRRFRWGALAACLALVAVMMSSAVVVFAAEAREYNAAVAFFEENGLSVEGLSRADVKAVYRD
ncbi:MAG: hypothetical protein IKI50_07005, partial [Clostridia bacterium]|nr:hypothetical protein [Clostridia bacterium]